MAKSQERTMESDAITYHRLHASVLPQRFAAKVRTPGVPRARRARGPAGFGTPWVPGREGCVPPSTTARRAPQGRRRRSKAGRFSTRPQVGEGRPREPWNVLQTSGTGHYPTLYPIFRRKLVRAATSGGVSTPFGGKPSTTPITPRPWLVTATTTSIGFADAQ